MLFRASVALVALAVLIALGSSISSQSSERSAVGYSAQDQSAIARALSKRARDPSSIVLTRLWMEHTASQYRMICGAVNGKNAFGGYTGEQAFTATFDTKTQTLNYLRLVSDEFSLDDLLHDCMKFGMSLDQFERID